MIDPTDVARRLAALTHRIAGVERSWDHEVEAMVVTKGFGPDAIRAAVAAGATTIGENYAQELLGKAATIGEYEPDRRPDVAFIGRLQSNKVRQLAGTVDLWASVDRSSLVREIAKRDPGARVLIQVNSTDEPHKGGCAPADTASLVAAARDAGLDVGGLLTVGPTGAPAEAARPGFELVRRLVDDLELGVCSMGMTADLEIAVECGSTQVRVGTGVFGPRP